MNIFMQRAIDLAIENVKNGGQPFGAILVKDETIISEGVNELHKEYDISGHAELIAIKKAQNILQTHDLSAYTIYASGHPCPMCLTAIYFSGIKNVYYCASLEDAENVGFSLVQQIYTDLTKPNENRTLIMKQLPLEKNAVDPMKMWGESKLK